MRWAFVGSSPAAPQHVATVLPTLAPCRTITTNAGIKLLPTPDVYFLSDRVACARYMPYAHAAKAQGTHCATLYRFRSALKERGLEWFDEFIVNGVDPPTPERWSGFNQSGAFCMEYACRNGATELHLLGCEGYGARSYFDQDTRPTDHKIADSDTTPQLVLRTTFVVRCFPAVRFIVYGEPRYTIDAPNWHVHPVQQAAVHA